MPAETKVRGSSDHVSSRRALARWRAAVIRRRVSGFQRSATPADYGAVEVDARYHVLDVGTPVALPWRVAAGAPPASTVGHAGWEGP
jgi:hypothetical protein